MSTSANRKGGSGSVSELPRIRGSRLIYEGRVVTMRVDDIELSDGSDAWVPETAAELI